MTRQTHQDAPGTRYHRGNGEDVPETTRDTEVKETNQSGFDPAGFKSLLYVDERDKGCARDGSRCEQPERGSTHQSTREVALCVGGTQGDDESGAKHS